MKLAANLAPGGVERPRVSGAGDRHGAPGAANDDESESPMLNSEAGYRRLFFIAALYNLVLGLIFLVFFARLMTLFGMPTPPQELAVFHQMGILLAMVYGAGYYMVSRDLYAHKGIVLLGIIGKTVVFLLFFFHLVFSGLHPLIFMIGAGDLAFALLFCKFLAFARNEVGTESPQAEKQWRA